jgi:tRNA threonylcarbamoyladenosine biosynthesis protein TsaE
LPLEIVSHSPEETQALGRKLGELAKEGDVILLVGGLGTGKTCLVQGLARGLGIRESTLSPSFVILRIYQGRLPLYHLDFYRLEEKDVLDLGLEEYLSGEGIAAVEWADRCKTLWPPEYLLVSLDLLAENERRLRFEPRGKRHEERVEALKGWSWP